MRITKWFEIENFWKNAKLKDFEIPIFSIFNFPTTPTCKTQIKGFCLFGFSFQWCKEVHDE